MALTQIRSRQSKTRRSPCGECRLEVIRTATEARAITDAAIAAMAAARFSQADQFAVDLALEEAVVNALRHGNRSDPAKAVTVFVRIDEDQVVVEVEDEGDGFDPAAVPDPRALLNLERPSGRGLLLMRHYMSWVRFNQRGNRVTLCRYRSV